MIELLILYILNIRDKTVYALRREIVELFGAITKPSMGTIHPALKRLLKKEAVKFEQKYSEGGKKSTYYSITPNGKKVFKELFFEAISDNPTIFHNHLSARLLTLSMLDASERAEFLNDLSKRLEMQKIDIEKALNNTYIEYDVYQKTVISATLNSIEALEKTVEVLKNN